MLNACAQAFLESGLTWEFLFEASGCLFWMPIAGWRIARNLGIMRKLRARNAPDVERTT